MKRFLLSCLLMLSASVWARADILGQVVSLTPPAGWERVRPDPASLEESPFPTLKYLPKDGHYAEIVITLLPSDVAGFTVTDAASLKKFSVLAAQPYLNASAPMPHVAEFILPDGVAVSLTTACPTSPGKEPSVATIAGVLIGSKHLIHVAILHKTDRASEFVKALQTMLSMRFVAPTTPVAQTRR